jgi:hypothetical protein
MRWCCWRRGGSCWRRSRGEGERVIAGGYERKVHGQLCSKKLNYLNRNQIEMRQDVRSILGTEATRPASDRKKSDISRKQTSILSIQPHVFADSQVLSDRCSADYWMA